MADLGKAIGHEQSLRRPVLIISANPWLETNPPVIAVLPFTRARRGKSTHVEVELGESGLQATSYIKCEDICAVWPLRLERRYGNVDQITLVRTEIILQRLLGL